MGTTANVLNLEPMSARWQAFGWNTVEVDGHDLDALGKALSAGSDRPRMIVARTVMGRGVDFMEGRVEWHYRVLTPELRAAALSQTESGTCAGRS